MTSNDDENKPSRPDLTNECEAHKYTCDLLEHIVYSLDSIEEIQVRQEQDIRHHIERTDQLQELAGKLTASVSDLTAFKNQIVGALKLVLSASAIAALVQLIRLLF